MNPQNNPVEPKEDNKPSAPITVMDIQPPSQRTVQTGTDIHINSEDGTLSQPEEANQTGQSIPVNIASAEDIPAESIQESEQQTTDSSPLNTEQTEQIGNQQPQSIENPMAINQSPNPKSKTPTIIIIIAIFVVIGLISAAIVLFLNKDKKVETSTSTSKTTSQPSGASQQDVDNTVSELDKEVQSTDDQTDIPSAESINDASLGL